MNPKYYISHVHSYDNHRFCVAGTYQDYRYMVTCPNGKALIADGFSNALEAIRAAQREAILLSIRSSQ